MGTTKWTRQTGSTVGAARSLRESARHLHGRGHLASGGSPRCGCGPEVLEPLAVLATLDVAERPSWTPLRRQLVGFVRAHTIYSTRTPDAFR